MWCMVYWWAQMILCKQTQKEKKKQQLKCSPSQKWEKITWEFISNEAFDGEKFSRSFSSIKNSEQNIHVRTCTHTHTLLTSSFTDWKLCEFRFTFELFSNICHPVSWPKVRKKSISASQWTSLKWSRCLVIRWAKEVHFIMFACYLKCVSCGHSEQPSTHILTSTTFCSQANKNINDSSFLSTYSEVLREVFLRERQNYAGTWCADSISFFKETEEILQECQFISLCIYAIIFGSAALFNYYQTFEMLKHYALCTLHCWMLGVMHIPVSKYLQCHKSTWN